MMAQGPAPTPTDGGLMGGFDAALSSAFLTGKAPGIRPSDPYKDKKRLLDLAKKCKTACIDQDRWTYERVWWRNILYQLGRQWVYFDGSRNSWRDKRLQPWMPRPVTNKIAETVDSILSVFQSVQLGANAMPIAPTPADEATAQTLNRLQPAIHAEHNMDALIWEHDWWLLVTGNAFLHPWWDANKESGFIVVDFEQCTACGLVANPKDIAAKGNACPQCGNPVLKPAIDQDGRPVQERVTFGRGCTDVLSPLELAVPNSYGHLNEMPYVIRKRWRAKSWYERFAPQLVKTIQWEETPTDRSLQLLRGISTAADIGPAPGAMGMGSSGGGEEGITEYELWYKPDTDWPEGALVRFTQDFQLVELENEAIPGRLPLETPDGDKIIPFVHTRYEIVGGRFWGRSPVDRLIQKQDQINQIDALIQLIIQRCANPIWLKPKGSEVRRFTGEPGLVVDYTPSGTGNNKPERVEGAEVPSSLFRIRDGYFQDFEALAGTYDVIKGAKPSGVEAFSALQLLVERSQSRYGPVLAARGRTYRDWYSMAVELERQYGPEERVWQALGPNQQWTFDRFQHAQLQGNVRIIVEDGSQTPKTSLGKRAAIQQLQTLGVIDPQNPETAFEILKTFGETALLPSLDNDVQAVLRVQDEFEKWARTVTMVPAMPTVDPMSGMTVLGMPQLSAPAPGKRLPWQNAGVFVVELKKWANSDRVTDLLREKPWLESTVGWLIQQHEFALMPPPMPGAPGPGGGGGGAGQAMANSNSESGNPADVPSGQGEGPQNQGPQ